MSQRLRSTPGVIFAVLTIFLALGHAWLGIYPYGTAVWIRPILAAIGIAGAVMLIVGNAWWRVLLAVWCLAQTLVIATDVSGEWLNQGIWLEFKSSDSVKINNVVTQLHVSGINFAGLALALVLLVIALLRLHPRIRSHITRRQVAWASLAAALLALPTIGLASWRHVENKSATFVMDLDLPRVPIYYQDKMLGHTPLAFTPAKVKSWGLPLTNLEHLKMYSTGWADAEILSDGTTDLPLYAGVPGAFADKIDTFDSPWGKRARMHLNHESDTDNQRWGYMYRKATLRDEPVLTIQVLNANPVLARDVLHIRCKLANPTSRTYTGVKASIESHFFSFNRRHSTPTTIYANARRKAKLPQDWNRLSPGATLTADLNFDAPTRADAFELFCTFNLFAQANPDHLVTDSVYSNMLCIKVMAIGK